jgi:nicotinate-nucleotide adenylyltransferase
MLKLPPFGRGQRIGLFGGSFNPAHQGHVEVALFALKCLQLDTVWWLVSPQNPLKDSKETDDYSKRLAATKSIADHPRFVVTDLEQQIASRNTVQTLISLSTALKSAHFVWIMGADSFRDLHRWRNWTKIARLVPMAVLARPGYAMRGLSGHSAVRFTKYRLPNERAGKLATCRPPAWVFISMPLRNESSTAIRQSRKAVSNSR